MPEHVIVTGGAGYVGSHACKALSEAGYVPVVYDNLSIGNRWAVRWGPLELGDIMDAARLHEVFRRYRPVAVMHFAALALVGESMREPSIYFRTNVGGALGVIDACRVHDVGAFVFSSTCAVYGVPSRLPIGEGAATEPVNPYGASKLMVERILGDYHAAYDLPYTALRYFNAAGADLGSVIGECRAVETHLIPLALEAILGRRPPLTILGEDYPTPDGTAIRDYIHVSDLASAHVEVLGHLLRGGASGVANLGTGIGYSVREVIAMAERVSGRPLPSAVHPRRPGDPPELVADPSAAAGLLGADWARHSDLPTIIETAWRWHSAGMPALIPREMAR